MLVQTAAFFNTLALTGPAALRTFNATARRHNATPVPHKDGTLFVAQGSAYFLCGNVVRITSHDSR